ncbi:MAG TPA: ABC transporter permease [Polyangia bacterium]|nr:ABC transporter permease [Polyangia bacterium]
MTVDAVSVAAAGAAKPRRLRASASSLLPLGALVGALGLGLLLVKSTGVPLKDALAAFWDGVGGSPYAMVGSVTRGVPLALVGLGFILAERANLTNVGGEGQICMGGMFATAASLSWGAARLPGPLAVLFPLLAGTLAGALWGALAGVLKARRGSNEVITTLLLTFIATQLVYGAVQSVHLLRQPMTDSATLPESLEIPARTQLPVLTGGSGLPLHVGIVIELLVAVAIGVLLARSAVGLELRAVGLNETASRRAGLPVEKLLIGALAGSGALGGLAGAIMIQGDQHYLTSGFSSGFGFDGLVVGLLARGSATAVVAFALLFGCLRSGGMSMEMSASVPSAIVVVCQGVMVVAMATAAALGRRSKA